MKSNPYYKQLGFTIIEGLLISVIVIAVGAIGYLVYQRQANDQYNKEADEAYSNYVKEAQADYADYKAKAQPDQ